MTGPARVLAVSRDGAHRFSKSGVPAVELAAGLGVVGDAHSGVTVQHRSRVARDPTQPNLRQVHLIHGELLASLREDGYDVPPGALGENITTVGIALLDLPRGTLLHIGATAVVEITGLRNPCTQIEKFRTGLLGEVVGRDEDGRVVRRAGVMSVVLHGGPVRPGDEILVALPTGEPEPLQPV